MIAPFDDRVLIRPIEAEDITAGGLVLPSTAQESVDTGEVVAVGPGKPTDEGYVEIPLSVGDKVIYSKFAGTDVKSGGEDLKLFTRQNIYAVLDS